MFRKAFHLAVAFTLFLAAIGAPFAHYHPEDPEHEHASGLGHLHLGHAHDDDAAPAGPVWDHADGDETAVSQEWSAESTPHIEVLYTADVTLGDWEPQFTSREVAPEFTVRSHDPPPRGQFPPRAPPV